MAEEIANKANEAFIDEDYVQAVDLYTQAISLEPSKAAFYASRAQAHLKLENFTDVVADANKAIELDSSLSKAYLRKGMACFSLEEYHTALDAFKAGAALDPQNSLFKKWISKCEAQIHEEDSTDAKQSHASCLQDNGLNSSPAPLKDTAAVQNSEPVPSAVNSNPPLQPGSTKYRHEYYQSSTEVVVSVFAKGLSKENVTIDFGEQFLSIIINRPGEDTYFLQKRLFAKIIPAQCKFSILSTKIEIRLAKADLIQWSSLDYIKDQPVVHKPSTSVGADAQRPKYPSSNKKSNTDWDKLEAQMKKEEKEEKLEGDAALNKLFRDIYQDADDDTRRAMLKSFTESNGTVLSTNWKEVGAKRVEGTPPQGMEMKKWEL
eukprot:TRINITY_DN9687_c0_g2_i2.p1 TRINITY_DN9687_c0_g2~~TRINITY_DN9687_c0_g2_i2.p1  ORF type:complete len:376 (-),score=94.87 TRINITY_DN9687_c0_g2_i2:389-1516(-)